MKIEKLNIFAVPYAGGNAAIYNKLKKKLPDNFVFKPLDIPGHGIRSGEPLLYSILDVADDILNQIKCNIYEDYCLLGYSMGSILCFEVIKKLVKNNLKLPKYTIFCASPPPNIKNMKFSDIRNAEKEKVVDFLKELGGTAEEIFNNEKLIDFILPVIRADLIALEEYKSNETNKLDVRSIVIYSNDEKEHIYGWNDFFVKPCEYKHINDGHFFINYNSEALATELLRMMQ